MLLTGATGTGKSYLARLMYQYACQQGTLSKDSPFVTINCAEYADNPELFLTHLFGYKKGAYTGADSDRQGFLAAADGGVLFLDEVHALKPECQEKIFLFLDQGIYHMIGDNETWYSSHARVLMATTENPQEILLKTLLRRIPIHVQLPDLEHRPLSEKRELIVTLFLRNKEAGLHGINSAIWLIIRWNPCITQAMSESWKMQSRSALPMPFCAEKHNRWKFIFTICRLA